MGLPFTQTKVSTTFLMTKSESETFVRKFLVGLKDFDSASLVVYQKGEQTFSVAGSIDGRGRVIVMTHPPDKPEPAVAEQPALPETTP